MADVAKLAERHDDPTFADLRYYSSAQQKLSLAGRAIAALRRLI